MKYEGINRIRFIDSFRLSRVKFNFVKHIDLLNRILNFIDENKIYKKIELDDSYKIVSPFISVEFNYGKSTFIIRFDSEGVKYTTSLDSFRIELSNLFYEFELEDVYAENGITSYVFSALKTERIYFSEIEKLNLRKVNDLIIPLNSKSIWNLNKSPHAIISGSTGKGKTFFIYYLVYILLLHKAEIHIIDAKNTKLGTLKYLNEKINCYSDLKKINADAFDLLRYLESEIEKRSNLLAESNKNSKKSLFADELDYRDLNLNAIVFILDEVKAFNVFLNKSKQEFENRLSRIIMLGRQLGIFVILSTQKVDVDTISNNIKVNCSALFVVGNLNSTALVQIFGSSEGIEKISDKAIGEGYFSINNSDVKKIKYPLLENINFFDNELKRL